MDSITGLSFYRKLKLYDEQETAMNKSDPPNTFGICIDKSEASRRQAAWLLKTGLATKLGKHAAGGIRYEVLADQDRTELMIRITGNDGGGYVSKDILLFDGIEASVRAYQPDKPFPTKVLQSVFLGRSTNNPAFLAAVLRAESLLALVPETEGRHIISGNWASWKASMLSEPGQAIDSSPPLVADLVPDDFPVEAEQVWEKKKVSTATRRKK